MADRLLSRFGPSIVAVGLYGSLARGADGPYSDVEMVGVLDHPGPVRSYEFVYRGFKVEVDLDEREALLREAAVVDDAWPTKAGQFADMVPLYDPHGFLPELRRVALAPSPEAVRSAIVQAFVDEPYETMGKVRNAWAGRVELGLGYLPLAAVDLVGQTAKLLGLAHRHHYRGRPCVVPEALTLEPLPAGYRELADLVTRGDLGDPEQVYACVETLWAGLLGWMADLGLAFARDDLPF